MRIYYFRQCVSGEGKRKERGNVTEYVSVALHSYHYMLHPVLHTLVKGN